MPTKTYKKIETIVLYFVIKKNLKIRFQNEPEHETTHGENFMAIFTTLSVVIWFSAGTLGIFATLVYVFTMRVIIYDTLT